MYTGGGDAVMQVWKPLSEQEAILQEAGEEAASDGDFAMVRASV